MIILHELKHLQALRHPTDVLVAMGVPNRDQDYFYRGILRDCFGINVPQGASKDPRIWPKL
jgi:hypothetical protein